MYKIGDKVMLFGPAAAFGVGGVALTDVGVVMDIEHIPTPARCDTAHYVRGEMVATIYEVRWPSYPEGGWSGAYYDLVLADADPEYDPGGVPCPVEFKRKFTIKEKVRA